MSDTDRMFRLEEAPVNKKKCLVTVGEKMKLQ